MTSEETKRKNVEAFMKKVDAIDVNTPEWKEYCDNIDNFDFTIGNQEEYKHLIDQQQRKTA